MADEIQVGDRVRSFDFTKNRHPDGPRACYVEGTVRRIGPCTEDGFDGAYDRYKIQAEVRVFAGERITPEGPYFYPPLNGTETAFGEIMDGVEKIE